MFKDSPAYSGFSVGDLEAARKFYGNILGFEIINAGPGFVLKITGNKNGLLVYPKDNHEPATFTILNIPVDDIDEAVDALVAKGIKFEHYPEMTDDKGIARGIESNMGPDIAWFKDPAGNILSVLHEERS